MYANRLGEIRVDRSHEFWPTTLTYHPEPKPKIEIRQGFSITNTPFTIHRDVVRQEEALWKQMVPLKDEYSRLLRLFREQVKNYNQIAREYDRISAQLGQPSTIQKIDAIASHPAAMVFPLLKLNTMLINSITGLFSGLFGDKKRKARRLNELQEMLTAESQKMMKVNDRLVALTTILDPLVQQSQGITQTITATVESNDRLIKERQAQAWMTHDAQTAYYRQLNRNRVPLPSNDLSSFYR